MPRPGSIVFRVSTVFCAGLCALLFEAPGFAQSNSTLAQFDSAWVNHLTSIEAAQFPEISSLQKKSTSDQKKATDSKAADKKQQPNVSKERRDELMGFVKKHHPDLQPLLQSLQKTSPEQYKAAMRTLDREVKSLQALEKRAPQRYEKSLELWITKSKIKLLSAQLAIKETLPEQQAIEKQIFQLIAKQEDLRIASLAADTKTLESRLEKSKSDLKKLRENRKDEIQRQMDVIKNYSLRIRQNRLKEANAKKKTPPTQNKPSANKSSTDKKTKSRVKDDKIDPTEANSNG